MEINGAALKVMRERSGLSQAELARRSGVSQGHISGLEAGDKKASPNTLKKLADALAIPVVALVPTTPAEVA